MVVFNNLLWNNINFPVTSVYLCARCCHSNSVRKRAWDGHCKKPCVLKVFLAEMAGLGVVLSNRLQTSGEDSKTDKVCFLVNCKSVSREILRPPLRTSCSDCSTAAEDSPSCQRAWGPSRSCPWPAPWRRGEWGATVLRTEAVAEQRSLRQQDGKPCLHQVSRGFKIKKIIGGARNG